MLAAVNLDVLIFGGGAAGLWLLDDLLRAGYRALLLEAHALGSGQTVASQGIIHGGLKYSLGGFLTPSARAIRDMPRIWRRCLAGEIEPDLSGTHRRAEFCHLWQTSSIASRAAMIGARAGLRIAPVTLPPEARPAPLRACPGLVARLDEQVISPAGLISVLANRHSDHIRQIDTSSGLEFGTSAPGVVDLVRLINPQSGDALDVRADRVVFTAGGGNDDLRSRAGLTTPRMQRRPLHMVVLRGDLPVLNGHCVDGLQTRATISSARDFTDRTVWQVGGRIAEDGVGMDRSTLLDRAREELAAILPGVNLDGVEWSTYTVDRAESASHGRRPDGVAVHEEGTTITAWPTKLALVPHLASEIRRRLRPPGIAAPDGDGVLTSWPRPDIAAPPWEGRMPWSTPPRSTGVRPAGTDT